MRYKIGFTGTHGTGKTTLAYGVAAELQKSGYNTAIINEAARETRYAINNETSHFAQTDILVRQIRMELDAELRPVDFIITDRTVLDPVAYTLYAEQRNAIEFGWGGDMLPLAMRWLGTYNMIFYVKPAFDLDEKVEMERKKAMASLMNTSVRDEVIVIEDGERWATFESMKEVDDILYNLYIDKTDTEIIVIDNSCALADRLPFVINKILETVG